MDLKWCTMLDVVLKKCPIVFRGQPSNSTVTRAEKLTIWIQFEITRPVAAIKSLRFALFVFQTLALVWLWISTPNLSSTILMYMCRSLLIFSNINCKMAARQPYWIFWFPDSYYIPRIRRMGGCYGFTSKPPAAHNGVNTITQKPRDGLFSNLVYTLVVIVSWPD